jgi:putrescine transport system permease protein
MTIPVSRTARLGLTGVLGLGLLFLYAPILIVVLFSFNGSTSTTIWSGFSLRWYGELEENDAVLRAAGLSLAIAAMSASGASVIGTLVAYILSRYERFRGHALLFGMATAPLVMPEVILAVSLLLLFVSAEALFGWPKGRGVLTITLAHISYTASFVTIAVLGRLAGIDRTLEEAAQDLGASPPLVFLLVILPMIAPAIAAGWLLGFSISLDDVVITQFTAGPGSTTLPLLIFSLVRRGVKPDINAIATLFVVSAILVTIGIILVQRWRTDRSNR